MSKSQAEKAYEYDRTREALAKKGRTAGLAYEVDRLLRGTPYLYPSVNIKLDPACPPGKVFARNPTADRPTDSINGCEVSFVAFDESYVSPTTTPAHSGFEAMCERANKRFGRRTPKKTRKFQEGYRVEIISGPHAGVTGYVDRTESSSPDPWVHVSRDCTGYVYRQRASNLRKLAAPTPIRAFLPGQRVRVVAPDSVYAGKTGLVMGAEGNGYRVEIISAGRARKLYFGATELAFVEPTPSFPVGSTVALKSNGRRATVTSYNQAHHLYSLHFHDCSNSSLECYPYAGEQLVAATPAPPVNPFKIGDRVQSVRHPTTFGVVTAKPSSDSVVVLWGGYKKGITYRGERELKWLRAAPAATAEPRAFKPGDRVRHVVDLGVRGTITHMTVRCGGVIVLWDNGVSYGYADASQHLRRA